MKCYINSGNDNILYVIKVPTYPSSEDIYFEAIWLLCWTHSRQMVWPFGLHQTHLAADMSSCTFLQSSQKVFFPARQLFAQDNIFLFLKFLCNLPSWCSAHVSRDGLHLNAVHHRSGSSSIASSTPSPLSASSSSSTSPSSSSSSSSPSSLHQNHRQHHCTLILNGLGFHGLLSIIIIIVDTIIINVIILINIIVNKINHIIIIFVKVSLYGQY